MIVDRFTKQTCLESLEGVVSNKAYIPGHRHIHPLSKISLAKSASKPIIIVKQSSALKQLKVPDKSDIVILGEEKFSSEQSVPINFMNDTVQVNFIDILTLYLYKIKQIIK